MTVSLTHNFAVALSGARARADGLIADTGTFEGPHEIGQPRGREALIT